MGTLYCLKCFCDDKDHDKSSEKYSEVTASDIEASQEVLERSGWQFWRHNGWLCCRCPRCVARIAAFVEAIDPI